MKLLPMAPNPLPGLAESSSSSFFLKWLGCIKPKWERFSAVSEVNAFVLFSTSFKCCILSCSTIFESAELIVMMDR